MNPEMNPEMNHLHNRASDTIKRLNEIERRIARVTSSVCGSVPESSQTTPKPIEEHLHDKFDSISYTLNQIIEKVARLENAVGNHQSNQLQKSAAVGY